MKRKVLVVFFICVLLLSLFFYSIDFVPTVRADHRILYVGGFGTFNYTSIQAAINDAEGGDIIEVYDGTYYENITINKQIILRNATGQSPVINGSLNDTDTVRITTSNVRMSNFNIVGHVSNSGLIVNSLATNIKNVTISGNTFSGNNFGITLYHINNALIKENIIQSNGKNGINIEDGIQNKIIANTLNQNDFGISLVSSSNNSIIENTLSKNNCGIVLDLSSNNIIFHNNITLNTADGISFKYSTNNTIISNLIGPENDHGIDFVYSSNHNTIDTNTIFSNNGIGINFSQSSQNTMRNNTIKLNKEQGIVFSSFSNNNTILNNTIESNWNHGIYSLLSLNNTITWNSISSNNYSGIALSRCSSHNITNNTIFLNYENGTCILQSNNNTIFNNTISLNEHDGLYFNTKSNSSMISRNTIKLNDWNGVYIEDTSSCLNRFYHNNFIENGIYNAEDKGTNFWNASYPSGGNYWKDFSGNVHGIHDNYTSENQDVIGHDGIMDNGSKIGKDPYPIPLLDHNKDWYPLLNPYGSIINLNTSQIFLTIQQAIDNQSTENGHTILVKNGTYYEHLTVNKSLTILGQNRTTTVINASSNLTPGPNPINITADHVTVDGFTLTKNTLFNVGSGCFISGNYTHLNNTCIFLNTIGIAMNDSHNNSITNNILKNNTKGMNIHNSKDNSVSSNTIIDSHGYGGYGIFFDGGTKNNISKNHISLNDAFCLSFLSTNNNTISDNALYALDSQNYGQCAIYIYRSQWTRIFHNTIDFDSNTDFGTYMGCGITIQESENTAVGENTITRQKNIEESDNNFAIYLSSSGRNSIYNNNFCNFSPPPVDDVVIYQDDFSDCLWNLPYPAGGNYWSSMKQNNPDDHTGEHQNIEGHDLICDGNYSIKNGYDPALQLLDKFPFYCINGWDHPKISVPPYNAINTPVTTDLIWTIGDIELPVNYSIFFGTSYPPGNVVPNQTSASYDPGTLQYSTTYYWSVVAYNMSHIAWPGPLWQFTTEPAQSGPGGGGNGPEENTSAPIISNIRHEPTIVTNNDVVTISVTVTDDTRVANVTLHWNDGTLHTKPMTLTTNHTYTTRIGPFPALTTIIYWIIAEDNTSQTTRSTNYSFIVIDNSGPIITIVTPGDGTTIYTTNPVIKATYEDPSGINTQNIRFIFDGRDVAGQSAITTSSITFQTHNLSFGEHTVRLRVTDLLGYASWKNWSFTVAPNAGIVEVRVSNITAGHNTTIIPEQTENTFIDSIEIKTTKNLSNVSLVIIKLIDKPGEIINTSSNLTVFVFLDVTLLVEGISSSDEDIESITIHFKVEQQWINDQNIDTSTVALSRYHNDNWISLPTIRINDDAIYVYYQAVSPGLSTFAVVGSKVVEINPYQSGMPEIPWIVIIGVIVAATILLIVILFKAGYIYREEETNEEPQKPKSEPPKEEKP